ncbi:5-azacytidine-induced protein 2 [Lepisosteus oculatus]|uniref:5-azacytidine-induced protein 2 n=1 Tax=Lepisosteus oculatus TaxID=7918 RepID=W5M2Z8_LEPOC|nr:PREDICTED: 5-azacytidine-induced protein 2 [Lepisosteus oculatus]
MDSLAVEDDICILRHETADSLLQPSKESPVSASSGDESVASHFALVTAYEDIKKRLKEAEKENALLKKRVKQLEEKLFKPHELTSEGSKYVNQAYNAYVGVYMEKTDLQRELDKVKREKTESETLLNEQLQAKELELLQLRTDVETSQVMKTMNSTQDYWDVYKVNSELKIHTLQQELELLHLEYNRLQEKYKDHHCSNVSKTDWNNDTELNSGDASLLKTYVDLRREMSNLYAVTKSQAKMVRKLRDSSQSAVSRGPASVPVQCFEDVENNHRLVRVTAPGSPLAGSGPGPTPAQGPTGELWPDPWTSPRPPPVGSPGSYARTSLDDGSWSFPSPPKPSDALFWEAGRSASSSDAPKSPGPDWLRPY